MPNELHLLGHNYDTNRLCLGAYGDDAGAAGRSEDLFFGSACKAVRPMATHLMQQMTKTPQRLFEAQGIMPGC